MDSLLLQLGIGVTSSFIYDLLKGCAKKIAQPNFEDYKRELLPYISVSNAEIAAKILIEFAARNGDIVISGSKIFSEKSISFESSLKGSFELKDSTSSSTKDTSIQVGMGASIKGQGGAKIEQTNNDSITFST
jgi:hypothetical protein